MNQVSCNKILDSIKQDNLALFSALTDKSKNLLFGRFPLLSLCYLYNANNIIKKFETELLNISNYNLVNENVEIYKKFKSVAGKSLRLYTKQNAVVSPLEMLAILHDDQKVKKHFSCVSLTNEMVENLTKIYAYNKQTVNVETNKIKVGFKPLTSVQKKNYKWGMALSLVCVVLFISSLFMFNIFTGLATANSPFKIYSQAHLYSALNSSGNYVLASNIELNNFKGNSIFSGTLDGAGYKISVKSLSDNQLLQDNKGTLKNLNITYPAIQKNITTSFSLLSQTNSGVVSNVNVAAENITLNTTTLVKEVLNVSAVANKNTGTIENCVIDLNAEVNANGGGETFVAGVCADNAGTINNCKLSGNVGASEADVAGICVNNQINSTIDGCINSATLMQTSEHNEWNPSLSGVALNNWGSVKNCGNTANLSVVSNNASLNAQGTAFLGGIVAYNYSEINHCKNTGNLSVSTKNIVAYCAGIFAHSTYWVTEDNKTIMPEILNCGVECEIEVVTNHEYAFAFSGGLGGFLYGKLNNCFSAVNFKTDYNKEKYYVGTALGSSYYDFWSDYICLEAQNNYVLVQNGVNYQIGSLITNGQLSSYGLDVLNGQINTLGTLDAIKALEVYYE